ncbi:MAG: hypothetical protein IJJ25_02490 [Lachnospiraceae bacterium]|nr:hypothetical protein [Lachnospiraceae bacterium]
MRAAIFVGKSLLKIFLLPVILCLTVIQWICTAAVSVVSILLELIGGVFIITGILSYLMGHEPLLVMWRMIGTGAGLCLLPIIGEWIAVQVSYLNLLAKAWLLS